MNTRAPSSGATPTRRRRPGAPPWVGLAALAVALGSAGCAEPAPTTSTDPSLFEHPCAQDGARLDVAPPDADYGDLTDGAAVWCGNPPQGGAPYTPFRVRAWGPEALADGLALELSAETPDGVELAFTELTMGVTCANVGESEGFWVGAEAHMRYNGWSLEALDGLDATIVVRAHALSEPAFELGVAADVALVLER